MDILGLPVSASYDSNGQYVSVTFETVDVYDSPLVVEFSPAVPVADFTAVGVPQAESALATAISGGGVTFAPFQDSTNAAIVTPDDGGGNPPKKPPVSN